MSPFVKCKQSCLFLTITYHLVNISFVVEVYFSEQGASLWVQPPYDSANINLTNRLATKNLDSALPDSITEWGLLAISASPDTGRRSSLPKCCINKTRQQVPH